MQAPRCGEEMRDGGQRERLQGGPGPAAAAHPLQEGAVRRGRDQRSRQGRDREARREIQQAGTEPTLLRRKAQIAGTTTREVSLDPRIRGVTISRSQDPLHFGSGFHAWVIGYFTKIASARLNALSIACSGVIPLFMASSIATLNTCSALTSAIAGLNAS